MVAGMQQQVAQDLRHQQLRQGSLYNKGAANGRGCVTVMRADI